MWTCSCGVECSDEVNFCGRCGTAKPTMSWYYIDNGMKCGPVGISDMKNAIMNGKIIANTLVWTEGFSEWKPAKETVLNQFIITIVPPISGGAISDKWLWSLATVPILVNIILFELGIRDSTLLTVIVIILNCVFLILDSNYLRKIKVDPGKWMYLGFLLVPVYLFIRAAKTTKKYACGIVWCVLWVLSMLPIW